MLSCSGTSKFIDRLAEGRCLSETLTLNKTTSFLIYVLNCTTFVILCGWRDVGYVMFYNYKLQFLRNHCL